MESNSETVTFVYDLLTLNNVVKDTEVDEVTGYACVLCQAEFDTETTEDVIAVILNLEQTV